MPDRPARPDRPVLLPFKRMAKRGRGGSAAGRIALLHALAHIEFSAIDLAVDMVGRFGALFPPAFVMDWLGVAADEAMHFALLYRRLRASGCYYGALPAHDGLWEAAEKTASDALARLAIVPLVLEARALDVTPQTIERLEANGDEVSARLLHRIYVDEIRHVAIGMRWFDSFCAAQGLAPAPQWRRLVREHFRDGLKPPFNDSARSQAGLTPDFYLDVAAPENARQVERDR